MFNLSNMKVKDKPYFDRPREKLYLRGALSLTDEELMMIILGSGIKGKSVNLVAKNVVNFFKGKMLGDKFLNDSFEDLQKIQGVGFAKASMLIAAFEFFSRYTERVSGSITSAKDVFPLVDFIVSKPQEYLVALNLDGRNRAMSKKTVTIGLIDQSLVHPREIFTDAIKEMAASIILVHNHPSGDLEPSMDDIKTTEKIRKAGELLGIPLLDHIIVSKKGYYSFKENHFL